MTDSTYRLASFHRPEDELARLRRQVREGLDREGPAYAAHGLLDAKRVLDVGAGSGEPARWIRSHGVTVTCADVDAAILAHAPDELTRVVCRGDALPFADASFDAAFSRFMLQHVTAPGAVVREMARVVAPTGRVILCDTDLRTFLTHPQVRSSERARAEWTSSVLGRGADPHVGMRLRALLVDANLSDVRVTHLVVTSDEIGPAAFADVALTPHARALWRDAPEQLQDLERELVVWTADDAAFGSVGIFVASGTR
ncbi:MAG: methyltransferase domain-containing protein [Myxococcales bacterium]|nr:methyltransferase domain-containing protein [Myxococcales bacterium]